VADVDVVVVGSGAAGLVAALTAQEEGARALVAESESVVGGATRLSGGLVMAAETEVQRAAGLEDDAAGLYQEYLLINQYETQPALAWRLAFDIGPTMRWLMELGVRFSHVVQGGGERVPRSHVADGGGQHLVDVLHQRCRERKIEIALGTRVERLLLQGDAVAGVAAGADELAAGAVVLAAGGFGANRSLIEKHLPTFARNGGDWIFYIGPDSSRGDALALGEAVGAHVVGHDRCVPLLGPRVDTRDFDAYPPGWSLVVGPDGRRVMDETLPYGVTFGLVNAAGGRVFALFDARTLADAGSPDLPTFKSAVPPNVWSPDGIQRLIASGAIVQAPTLEELASRLSIPAATMIGTIRRYNESAALGNDRDFRKDGRFLRPVETPPYCGAEIRPSALGITSCGLAIDAAAQVLNEFSSEIRGLFAAGECTGGVLGTSYVGSGNSLANCFVFGRTAGRSAAAYVMANR
jgi:succinate dehydrogenase/fumarate reductase flavoprotein subunit